MGGSVSQWAALHVAASARPCHKSTLKCCSRSEMLQPFNAAASSCKPNSLGRPTCASGKGNCASQAATRADTKVRAASWAVCASVLSI